MLGDFYGLGLAHGEALKLDTRGPPEIDFSDYARNLSEAKNSIELDNCLVG